MAPARRSLASRMLRSALSWAGVLALTLALGEGGSRFALGIRPLTEASLLWVDHPRWGWHHRPDAEDVFVKLAFAQPIRINSRGLREREISYEKPRGVRRVLVLGDSAVAAFEVPEEAAFPRVAEDRLRRRGLAVEFINAGVRGWGTDQELLYLRDEGLRYAPDVVLYKWTGNDQRDNATVHRPFRRFGKPWFDLDANGELALRGVPVPDYPYTANLRVGADGEVEELPVDWRSRASLWLRDVLVCRSAFATALVKAALALPAGSGSLVSLGAYRDDEDVPGGLDRDSRLFRVTVELVRAMQRDAEAAGARFAMLTTSGAFGLAVAEAAGLPANDVHERFRARVPEDAAILVPYDPHWNELGHRLYGEALAEWLDEGGWVGPGSGDGGPPTGSP